jgi:hypothetical protein
MSKSQLEALKALIGAYQRSVEDSDLSLWIEVGKKAGQYTKIDKRTARFLDGVGLIVHEVTETGSRAKLANLKEE